MIESSHDTPHLGSLRLSTFYIMCYTEQLTGILKALLSQLNMGYSEHLLQREDVCGFLQNAIGSTAPSDTKIMGTQVPFIK